MGDLVTLKPKDPAPPAPDFTNFSFATFPKSVTELKADSGDDPAAWTPRDVLIAALRLIDAGSIVPKSLLVVWRGKGLVHDDSLVDSYSGPDDDARLALVTRLQHSLLSPETDDGE